jgi:hypothetical protein
MNRPKPDIPVYLIEWQSVYLNCCVNEIHPGVQFASGEADAPWEKISAIRPMVVRISASVVVTPRLKRKLDIQPSSSNPMARNTWLGAGSADVQADPVLQAIPGRDVISRSARILLNRMLVVLGSRFRTLPLM